jgi:hypothetical protein
MFVNTVIKLAWHVKIKVIYVLLAKWDTIFIITNVWVNALVNFSHKLLMGKTIVIHVMNNAWSAQKLPVIAKNVLINIIIPK